MGKNNDSATWDDPSLIQNHTLQVQLVTLYTTQASVLARGTPHLAHLSSSSPDSTVVSRPSQACPWSSRLWTAQCLARPPCAAPSTGGAVFPGWCSGGPGKPVMANQEAMAHAAPHAPAAPRSVVVLWTRQLLRRCHPSPSHCVGLATLPPSKRPPDVIITGAAATSQRRLGSL